MTERSTIGRGVHLVERAAAQLRNEAGLAPDDPTLPDAALPDPAHFAAPAAPRAASLADAPRPDAPSPGAPSPGAPPLGAPPLGERPADGADGAPLGVEGLMLDQATLKRAGLALAGARSRVTEEYRITVGRILRALRSNAAGAQGNARGGIANLVMVTSARPGEGKSFSALNLAASIAQNGLSDVVLVDVDGKPRSITTLLGLRDRQGLLDLVDNATLRPEDLLVRTAIEGLTVLPLGLNRLSTAEGGVTRAVITAMDRLRRRFNHHILLLDTAPCLSTSDPSTLAPLVDQVIMVVEAGRTQRSELGAALELVKACPNVILVLNKVSLTHRHSFGSYYYFGYPS